MNCTSGCLTRNHSTYAECLRSKNLRVSTVDNAIERAFQRENDAYATAVKDGLEPAGVSHAAINAAYERASL